MTVKATRRGQARSAVPTICSAPRRKAEAHEHPEPGAEWGFAFDLRHEPAFWGIFQWVSGGHWHFLEDLSAADHCFWEFAQPINLFGTVNVTGINLLPMLMLSFPWTLRRN